MLDPIGPYFSSRKILKSPGPVVSMKAFYKEKKRYYLIFEIVSGGELFEEIVARNFYSEQDARYSCSATKPM